LKNKVHIVAKGSFWFYYIGSRVLHPAFVYPEPPAYESKLNELSYKIYKSIENQYFKDFQLPHSIGQVFYILMEWGCCIFQSDVRLKLQARN